MKSFFIGLVIFASGWATNMALVEHIHSKDVVVDNIRHSYYLGCITMYLHDNDTLLLERQAKEYCKQASNKHASIIDLYLSIMLK